MRCQVPVVGHLETKSGLLVGQKANVAAGPQDLLGRSCLYAFHLDEISPGRFPNRLEGVLEALDRGISVYNRNIILSEELLQGLQGLAGGFEPL